jgi:hypothetical protein
MPARHPAKVLAEVLALSVEHREGPANLAVRCGTSPRTLYRISTWSLRGSGGCHTMEAGGPTLRKAARSCPTRKARPAPNSTKCRLQLSPRLDPRPQSPRNAPRPRPIPRRKRPRAGRSRRSRPPGGSAMCLFTGRGSPRLRMPAFSEEPVRGLREMSIHRIVLSGVTASAVPARTVRPPSFISTYCPSARCQSGCR